MIKKIKDIDINYIQYGMGPDIVLLHGWGQNIEMMDFLGQGLKDENRITILDFPGFGKSSEPASPYNIYDYADLLKVFLEELEIKNPTLIGHSFGGRVALVYAASNDVKKLVLLGTPFKKEQELTLKTRILKSLKKIKFLDGFGEQMKKYIGSTDYKQATPMMRKILVNTVNEDLEECAMKIKSPTLLIWGERDLTVPKESGEALEKIISDSALIVLEGGHFSYLENVNRVISILKNFI